MCGAITCGGHDWRGFFFAPRRCLLAAAGGRAMQGSLGEKIGEGSFADVHAWAPGQVVKLFKAEFPRRIALYEARMTRAVFAAGGPAPEVLDEGEVEGRLGLVLPRLDGPTLLELLQAGAVTPQAAAAIL